MRASYTFIIVAAAILALLQFWPYPRFPDYEDERIERFTSSYVDGSAWLGGPRVVAAAAAWPGRCPSPSELLDLVVAARSVAADDPPIEEVQSAAIAGCRAAARCWLQLERARSTPFFDINLLAIDRVTTMWGHDGPIATDLPIAEAATLGNADARAATYYRIARRALDAAGIDPMDAVPACPAEDRPRLDRSMPYKKGETAHRWRPAPPP